MSGFSSLKVVELKALLRQQDLSVGGKKADLVARLEEAQAEVGDAAEAPAEVICVGEGCDVALSDEAVAKGHKFCPKCHKARLRKGGKGKRKGGRSGFVPSQDEMKDALAKAMEELADIKGKSSFKDGELRYDFAEADALFARATELFVVGKFGPVESEGIRYDHLGLFLYQAVLGAAYATVANGKLADARRVCEEEESDLAPIVAAEEEVTYLLKDGLKGDRPRAAARIVGRVLWGVLDRRRKARDAAGTADREAFVAKIKADSRPQKQQQRDEGGEGGGDRRRSKKSRKRRKKREPGGSSSEPYTRKGYTIGDAVDNS